MKKRCTICGTKITKKNNASITILGAEFVAANPKIQNICTECKTDLLYASIVSPFYK